ncbi:MAG: NAD(+)/NADH kinase [Bacteroidales bacterium]|nr:NAD(+)/NADH kinase [Bacteroidales bacterium]
MEKRDLLQVESLQLPTGIYPCCLNEFSIQRNKPSMLRISIAIDGTQLPSYWADGVVVASPTGSTAYSMSVGGPIVLPSSKVAVIAPIAPHNLNIRPLVVPLDSLIELKFEGAGSDAVVTMDNRDYLVPSGTLFKVRKAAKPVQCVLLNNMNFIEALQDKLLWGEDRRNLI